MKVGILTLHNNENKGALLQAYCLQSFLSMLTKSKVDVIDYRPLSKEIRRYIDCLDDAKNCIHNLSDLILCSSFQKNHLNLGSKKIITNSYVDALSWLKSQRYDAIIVGSDEVWNIYQGTEYNSFLLKRPFPNLYFLNPRIEGVKVSYAASFGRTNFELLSKSQILCLKNLLSKFDYISVRDSNSENILSKLGIKKIFRVPDPTLLMDIPEVNVQMKLSKMGVDFRKPLVGIHGANHPIFQAFCKIFRKKGYQIVSLNYSPYADINLKGKVTPFEYYSLYKYFDIVITLSLHSTIFSLKHGVPFVAVDISPVYKKINSKIHSLLEDFSMLDRYINANNYNLDENIECYLEPLKYAEIRERINSLKQKGLDFFSVAFKEIDF